VGTFGASLFVQFKHKEPACAGSSCLERVAGIEPAFLAWEATFLPLEDTRVTVDFRGVPTVVANDGSYSGASNGAASTVVEHDTY
jgi:hypothetical protein